MSAPAPDVERRLHRAAHELREMDVQIPPFGSLVRRRRRRLHRVASGLAAVVVAVGAGATALEVTGSTALPDTGNEFAVDPVGVAPVEEIEDDGVAIRSGPTAYEEVAMIASLGRRRDPSSPADRDDAPSFTPTIH